MLQESVTIGRDHASVADIPAVWRIWRTEKSQQKINPLAGESTILRIVNAMASDREGLPSEKEKRIQGDASRSSICWYYRHNTGNQKLTAFTAEFPFYVLSPFAAAIYPFMAEL